MNSRTYIRDPKRSVKIGQWCNGNIPAAQFPLFRSSSTLAPQWSWRAAALRSEKCEYRLLVQLRKDKPNFKAWLAVELGKHWAMAGRLESHPHAGLHCHAQCIENGVIAVDQIEPPEAVSIPHWKAPHRRKNRVLSESEAWHLALKFFRAQVAETGLLL